jgi:hypothetical protein
MPLAGLVCSVVLFALGWTVELFVFFHLFVFEKYKALRREYKYIYTQFPAWSLFLTEHVHRGGCCTVPNFRSSCQACITRQAL